jgi:hypothetical protein
MRLDAIIGMVVRAAMNTLMVHLPKMMARMSGPDGAVDPRSQRDIAQKMRFIRRMMRWFR